MILILPLKRLILKKILNDTLILKIHIYITDNSSGALKLLHELSVWVLLLPNQTHGEMKREAPS